jgi:intracellular multiplication protein IcmK
MKKNHLIAAAAITLTLSAMAQQQPKISVTTPQSQQQASQPKNNLGKQVPQAPAPVQAPAQPAPMPEVVMPKPHDVVEQSIDDIEDAQLTDEQYERLKKLYLRSERQKAQPYVVPAKPIIRTLPINLDPGVKPPVLRVTKGQLTTIVFSDVNGEPWLIKDVGLNRQMYSDGKGGNGGKEGGQPTEPTNVLTLEPLTVAAYGNVSVILKGLSTPVIFMLASAQAEVDVRVDAKVPGRNPDGTDKIEFTTMPGIDAALTPFLDGVPPQQARRLKVTGLAKTEAWMFQDNLYVRTEADVQYPAYMSSARSTAGRAVYRFDSRLNSVTLLSNGRAVTVFIEE